MSSEDQPDPDPNAPGQIRDKLFWIGLAVVLATFAALRWRLLDLPLERDEGEYAYAGRMILEGLPPYVNVYSMKLPGIYAAYALVLKVFGETHRDIHLALLVVNALSGALVFFLARRFFGPWPALAASALFGLLSMGRGVQGVFANAEHFVLPCALGGLLLLFRYLDEGKRRLLVGSGLCLGLAFLVKQHALLFLAAGGAILLLERWRQGVRDPKLLGVEAGIMILSILTPYLITCAIFLSIGAFGDFWYWTFDYARAYTGEVPFAQIPVTFPPQFKAVTAGTWMIWILAGLGLVAIWFEKRLRNHAPALTIFAVCSFLAICPGFWFRAHYWALLLPALALLGAAAVRGVANLLPGGHLRTALPVGLFLLVFGSSVAKQSEDLFEASVLQYVRQTYRLNPFPEALEVGKLIEATTDEDDRVAVIGSEPQIFFYSKRRAASGFMYTYPLMEGHEFALEMQRRMISEIEASEPKVVVFVKNPLSWLRREDSHALIFEWFQEYSQGLHMTAAVDTYRNGMARLYKGEQLAERGNDYTTSLEIYERLP